MKKKTDKVREAEALESTVNMSGQGEDPAVKAMLSDEFVHGDNKDASEIAMALVQILRGQQFLGDEIAKINERMSKMDEDALQREIEQKKYIDDVLNKAESLKATGERLDKIQANGAKMMAEAVKRAKAEMSVNNLKFEEALRTMPKETVVSAGELVTEIEHGQQVSKLIPEVIRIRNKAWALKPGVPTEVPKIVAERFRIKRKSQEETEARKQLLSENVESSELVKRWQEINNKYGSKTDALPIG